MFDAQTAWDEAKAALCQAGINLRNLGFVGHVSDKARNEIDRRNRGGVAFD